MMGNFWTPGKVRLGATLSQAAGNVGIEGTALTPDRGPEGDGHNDKDAE